MDGDIRVATFNVGLRGSSILTLIGGFRDTYLGRQVVSRPGGPRAGMGSAGVWERCELL